MMGISFSRQSSKVCVSCVTAALHLQIQPPAIMISNSPKERNTTSNPAAASQHHMALTQLIFKNTQCERG